MKRFEFWGNKKNIKAENGRVYLTEAQEQEFKELGIINEEGVLVDTEGIGTPYQVRETGCRVFQFHIPRDEWGKTYNLFSEKCEEGRRKVIFVPNKERFEIWENYKGEPRKMVKRVDGLNKVNEIVDAWNETYDTEISVDELEEAIR